MPTMDSTLNHYCTMYEYSIPTEKKNQLLY